MISRIVSRFSCGAASAVATKLILTEFSQTHDVHVINAFIEQEHPDNQRFLDDCEKWFGVPIVRLRDDKYSASTYEVFQKHKFMVSRSFAPCTKYLKRNVLESYDKPGDIWVLGYTSEEQNRLDRFIDSNNNRIVLTPLIDRGITKSHCLSIIKNANIDLPMMYKMGYKNNNCIGCVKGGEGYWNRIRVDFPAHFERIADIQETLGPGAYMFRDRKTGVRYSLRDLPPNRGRFRDEPDIECGAVCEMVEREFLPDWLK